MDAAHLGGAVHQEPVNVSRVDLGVNVENVVTFGDVAGAAAATTRTRSEVLFPRVEEELARHARRDRRHVGDRCRCSPATTGATTCAWKASSRTPTPTPTRASTRSAPAISTRSAIPVLAGREFTPSTTSTGTHQVAIVNETFAKKFNLGANAVGKHMATGQRRFAEHRDRRPGEGHEVQRGEGSGPAALLHALAPGRQRRVARTSTCAPRCRPRQQLHTISG